MKKFISAVLILCICTLSFSACGGMTGESNGIDSKTSAQSAVPTTAAETTETTEYVTPERDDSKQHVRLTIKDFGDIVIELHEEYAPITVENFVGLVKDGFYDGLTFHRIIKGFMIQGGDPLGTGAGGSDKTIKGEFVANGVNNTLAHTRGVISMARSGADMDSASSQFFICDSSGINSENLNGKYAAFGWVVEGMEVVDKIADTPVVDTEGTVQSQNQPVIEKAVMDD